MYFLSAVVSIDELGQLDVGQYLRRTFEKIGRQSVLYPNLHGNRFRN